MSKTFKVAIVALAIVAFGATANAAFNTNLTVGSTGADVSALQSWLISKGFAIPSISSGAASAGYFGAQTKAAVVAYQTSVGLPATGFVGPLTRGILNGTSVPSTPVAASCPVGYTCTAKPGTTAPATPSTGALAGTDGTISAVNKLSQFNNEEVGDGQTEVKVVGFEVEASKEGDIALKSINITFDGSSNTGSTRLNQYVEEVSVYQGSKKVGSSSSDDFNKDNSGVYSKTITLANATVKSDATEKFYITVDAVSNLDSGDISGSNDAWSVDINNIRYEDGSGVVSTDSDTGDLGGSLDNVALSFVSFATTANTELKFSTDSSSPDAGIIVIDDTSDTDNVTLLVGKVKVEGESDVLVDTFPVTLTTTADSIAAVTGSLTLKIDGEEFSETVSLNSVQTGSVTFDNLDLNLTAGKTYTFTVLADINDTNNSGVTATDFDEGDTLTASFTASNRNVLDAENKEGDQLSDSSEKSGTSVGDAQEFRTNGIGLALVSTATSATTGTSANDDVGLFTIKYKVTAIGDTVYISSLATSAGITYSVDKGGTATTSVTIVGALVNNTDTTLTSVGNYEIEEGQSETFTLSVSVPISAASGSGQYRTALTGVKWDTTDDTSMDNTYSSELDSFKTEYAVLN
jgi:peptidoglycan hydrolase-like protein with peptidoglycan-binding domain